MSSKKLVIIGNSLIARIACEYFTHDSEYEVVAFAVNRPYMHEDKMFHGLPEVAVEDMVERYPPSEFCAHVAVGYNLLNRVKKKLYLWAKDAGYTLPNYISSKAFVWRNVEMGDNNFIFEDNTVQPFVKMGSNNMLWSGNHIGHDSVIGNHNFISSHVVISGCVTMGDNGFYGVNSACAQDLTIADDNFFAMGAAVTKNTSKGDFLIGVPAKPHPRHTAYDAFKVPKEMRG